MGVRWIQCVLTIVLIFTSGLAHAVMPFAGSPFESSIAGAITADQHHRSKGNRLAIISGGYDALLLRVHLIRQAKTSIAIQTFIWTNDECGRLLIFELIESAG